MQCGWRKARTLHGELQDPPPSTSTTRLTTYSFFRHTSLLLPGAQLQVSPFKDMATMRNPCSSFSFTNYLFTKGRLASYINKENSIPSRREWSAYLTWCAERMEREMQDIVRYSSEVVSIEVESSAASQQSPPKMYKVTYRNTLDGSTTSLFARNITLAIGGAPSIPGIFSSVYSSQNVDMPRLVHSSHYLPSLAKLRSHFLESKRAPRIAVIGSGQSSAEMTVNLHNSFPNAQVEMIFRGPAIRPSDDSSFVNAAAFDPEATDAFWQADLATRSRWRKDFERTNYAVVRSNVLNELFTLGYDQQLELDRPLDGAAGPGEGTVNFRPNTQIKAVDQRKGSGPITLALATTGGKEEHVEEYDAVFLGTGFARQLASLQCVQPLAEHYPLIKSSETERIQQLGFEEPSTADLNDVSERRRELNRAITRDYRLVSQHALSTDPAFLSLSSSSQRRNSSAVDVEQNNGTISLPSNVVEAIGQRRDSERSNSSSASSATLADSGRNSPASQTLTLSATAPAQSHIKKETEANIYVMGCNEPTHGLSDSLLSVSAFRAGEVAHSLRARIAEQHGLGVAPRAKPALETAPKMIGVAKDNNNKAAATAVPAGKEGKETLTQKFKDLFTGGNNSNEQEGRGVTA